MIAGDPARRRSHAMGIVALIVAGEAIFSLPFHVMRFFRPTVLEVFQITNTDIGQVQATYGVVAMLSYFLGGPLADRFHVRNLLMLALLATGLGGLYYAQIPDLEGLTILFGFWGFSTILLFWGALIKATREWGGGSQQGVAFGFLEAGRGLFAAILVSVAIAILNLSMPEGLDKLGHEERRGALQQIIYMYVFATLCAAVMVALFIPASSESTGDETQKRLLFGPRLKAVFSNPLIWPQMIIVVSAYVAYKGVDNYVLFAVQGFGLDEVKGSTIGATSSWVRPIAALLAGFLADRYRGSNVVTASFALLLSGYCVFIAIDPRPELYWVLVANVVITSLAIYGLHAIYFALLAESDLPMSVTGTAIGVISVIGFTPDIFVAPTMGWLLDNNPVLLGHRLVFMSLAAFSISGLLSAMLFTRNLRRR